MRIFRSHGFWRRLAVLLLVFIAWGMASFCSLAKDSKAVRMRIHSLQASMGQEEIAVVLTDEAGEKFLPIAVGGDQALSIQLGRNGQTAKRPLTHDLLASIFKALEIRVEKVTITDLRDGVYYAEIALQQNGRTHQIDARPSDAIALSLRVEAPIYAMPHLLQDMSDLKTKEGEETSGQTEITSWGIKLQSLTESLADFFGRREGVLVADVMENSPASQSGLRAGDILLRLDKDELRDLGDFMKAFAARKEAQSVEIGVLRGDQNLTMTIKMTNE
jgi:bifunctional DNase/RNase